jgi:prolipoprotein diacylglyceryltransferase
LRGGGIERFIAEFFRAKGDRFLGPFTVAQAIAVGFIALGVAWLYVLRSGSPNLPGIYRQPVTALHSDAA